MSLFVQDHEVIWHLTTPELDWGHLVYVILSCVVLWHFFFFPLSLTGSHWFNSQVQWSKKKRQVWWHKNKLSVTIFLTEKSQQWQMWFEANERWKKKGEKFSFPHLRVLWSGGFETLILDALCKRRQRYWSVSLCEFVCVWISAAAYQLDCKQVGWWTISSQLQGINSCAGGRRWGDNHASGVEWENL